MVGVGGAFIMVVKMVVMIGVMMVVVVVIMIVVMVVMGAGGGHTEGIHVENFTTSPPLNILRSVCHCGGDNRVVLVMMVV